jgi:teichuronic acid biosynthesis glycosyltransferase TuaG
MITCSTVLVKRELLLRYPMDNDAVHEDFVAWLRILREGKPARGIDEPLVTYRVSRNSRSGDKIKAAKMRWKTYSFVGVPWYQAAWSMIFYAFNGVKKYSSIKR